MSPLQVMQLAIKRPLCGVQIVGLCVDSGSSCAGHADEFIAGRLTFNLETGRA